ncbi:MAG: hypothetical protein LDLANPLL_01250 [Turneriella sp.]|nr:hypothetical protein [Turneriella sp.]
MQKISIGAASSRQLVLNFNDVYADSIYTWIGGERYTLTLEDSRFDETPRIYSVNANGEEEALMFVSQALGRIKIINPPAALVAKAQELHLNADQLFRFTA